MTAALSHGRIVGNIAILRRRGREPVAMPHPALEPILARTVGVPLFQGQLPRIAAAPAGFTGGEAEELRGAVGFKRSERAMKDMSGGRAGPWPT